MPSHIYDRNDLIAMLRWQFEIGIDEALLDFPNAKVSPVKLDELLSNINATTNFPAKRVAGKIAGSMPEEVTKQAPSKNWQITDEPAVAVRSSFPNTSDLSDINSLTELRACLEALMIVH